MAMTDDFLDEIENYAIAHVGLDARDARELCRSIWQGERLHLPAAQNDAGRAEQSRLEAAIVAAIAPTVLDAVAATSTAATTPPPVAAPPASEPTQLSMSVETRKFIFQEMAGPRLAAFASALAETSASIDEATATIAVARAGLPPEKPAASGSSPGVWWRDPAFQGESMGGGVDFAQSKAEVAKAGWDKAFAKVAGRT